MKTKKSGMRVCGCEVRCLVCFHSFGVTLFVGTPDVVVSRGSVEDEQSKSSWIFFSLLFLSMSVSSSVSAALALCANEQTIESRLLDLCCFSSNNINWIKIERDNGYGEAHGARTLNKQASNARCDLLLFALFTRWFQYTIAMRFKVTWCSLLTHKLHTSHVCTSIFSRRSNAIAWTSKRKLKSEQTRPMWLKLSPTLQ